MLVGYYNFTAYKGFYLATLGSAKALFLDDKLGNFNVGKEVREGSRLVALPP